MKKNRRFAALLSAVAVGSAMVSVSQLPTSVADAAYGTGKNIVEKLDRGICAINTGNGMLVSWRYLANDSDSAVFKLYRDNTLIYTSEAGKATCYLDKSGSATAKYRVDTVTGNTVSSSANCSIQSNNNYFDIPLDVPAGGSYSPNDCSVGDVDGDGQYEIFLKWDPSNSKDNSQSGETGNVYIDCYTLNGKKLWRVDLGRNIRAGQHYTQFLVADFDCDGKAEMTCKTADGTVDGTGKVIGDKSKNYRNGSGYILDGPEFYTLFDGATGKALDTVSYEYPRGKVSDWGDNYGNRVDRFLGSVVYLDGVHPSAVSVRGYYTRMTAVAYDVVGKKLVKRWGFDTGNNKSAAGYSNGNHNCMPADVDGDGKQELFLGATCLDDNGKVLWCNNMKHGDALHIGDFLPDRKGLEAWVCHEEKGGVSLLDAATGKAIFYKTAGGDTGRCCADNIYAGNKGAEFWGAESNNVYDSTGKSIGTTKPSQSFLIYWDGDAEREILDGTKITKYASPSKINTLLSAAGCKSINSSKSNPCLSADILGDWREELILPTSDNQKLRVFCTPYNTEIRLTTLMHDVQYRMQVATEQNCYNQPPHVSFYLGSDAKLPERPAVTVHGGTVDPPSPPDPPDPPLPVIQPGDVNMDGKLDAADAQLMMQYLLNQEQLSEAAAKNADLNQDGKLNAVDLTLLKKALLQKPAVRLYAVDAAVVNGEIETINTGYTGTGYVNLNNDTTSAITWTVNAPSAGSYRVTFRVANGTDADRKMQVTVNGAADTPELSFPGTGSWTDWEEKSIVVSLNAGKNEIKLSSLTENGGPNFDYLLFEKAA